jgi:hypothetical protein
LTPEPPEVDNLVGSPGRRRRALLVALLPAIVLGAGVYVTSASSTFAADGCPGTQPKLDIEYQLPFNNNYPNSNLQWFNTCGVFYEAGNWNQNAELVAIRMPTSPTHRVWLHYRWSNGVVDAFCFYSQDTDIYMRTVNVYPHPQFEVEFPSDIQVSANTAPC